MKLFSVHFITEMHKEFSIWFIPFKYFTMLTERRRKNIHTHSKLFHNYSPVDYLKKDINNSVVVRNYVSPGAEWENENFIKLNEKCSRRFFFAFFKIFQHFHLNHSCTALGAICEMYHVSDEANEEKRKTSKFTF